MLKNQPTTIHPWLPLTLLILLGIIWGTGYSIARFATTNGVPPMGYSFWQVLGPAVLIGFMAIAKKGLNTQVTISAWRYYLICGLTGIVIPNTNMYLAAPHLPAGILALVVNTVPIFSFPMALFAKVETFSWTRFYGLICALVALLLLMLPKTSLPDPAMIPWVLSVLVTPLSFAFCSVYIARYQPKNQEPIALSAGMLFFASIMLIPLVFVTGNFYHLHIPLTSPDWVILLEIVLSSTGYILFFKLIKTAGPVYYSFVDTIVALTGLFWGYIIFNERLNEWSSLVVALILLALFMVNKQQQSMINFATLAKPKG